MRDYKKEFIKTIDNLDYSRRPVEKFRDFVTVASISLAQPFYRAEKLEKQYMEIVGKYTHEQGQEFPKLLGLVVEALEENPEQDFLGTVFMNQDMGNDYRGQFFTPYHVCKMMSNVTMGSTKEDFINAMYPKGYFTACEPCSGAGAMIIALRNTIIHAGLNPAECMLVTATDIDEICFYMAYLQFSLLNIPAVVVHGNTLTLEEYKSLYTPAYFLFNWQQKIKTGEAMAGMMKVLNQVSQESIKEIPEEVIEIIEEKGDEKPMQHTELLQTYGDICEKYYTQKQEKEIIIAENIRLEAKENAEKCEMRLINEKPEFKVLLQEIAELEGKKARFYYYVQATEGILKNSTPDNGFVYLSSFMEKLFSSKEPEKKTKKSKKEVETAVKNNDTKSSVSEVVEEPKDNDNLKTAAAEIDITKTPESEQQIDITQPPMPALIPQIDHGDAKEFVKNNPVEEKTPEKLTPEQRKEECEHADRCENPTKCSDGCNNRPDREPIKPASSFYKCPRCEQNRGKALVPNNHADLYNKSGLICSECREELEAISKNKSDESAKIFEDLENSKPEVIPKEDKKKQVSEKEALKTINAEATSLDDAIDKFEEYETTKEPEKTIDNSYIPEITEADKQKDAGFAGNPAFIKSLSDQFKTLSLDSGITEETWGWWVAYLKLEKNSEDVITSATRLLDYISNPSDITYFANRFKEELQKVAA